MGLRTELSLCEKISYMMYQNKMDIIGKAEITNDGEEIKDIRIQFESEPKFIEIPDIRMDSLGYRETVSLHDLPIFKAELVPTFFSGLEVRSPAKLSFSVFSEGNFIGEASCSTELLPYDTWPGLEMPETIAAFITPNADCLAEIRSRASDILGKWGCSTSLSGYQQDRDGVLSMTAAVFQAIKELNINYIVPPKGFDVKGQRIRMVSEVLEKKEGTCIDLAVLMSSVLESIGLNTILFFTEGHAFAGVHLDDSLPLDMLCYDSSRFRGEVSNSTVCVFECTTLCNSSDGDFNTARDIAYETLGDSDKFGCALDVQRARAIIIPLPDRHRVNGKWKVDRPTTMKKQAAPKKLAKPVRISNEGRKLTKADIWKRELLDLSRRNNMVSMKAGTKVVPLMISDIASFEDLLYDNNEYSVQPRPQEWDGMKKFQASPFDTQACMGNCKDIFEKEVKKKLIRCPLNEKETERTLRSISRSANNELEESGCNSLFLTLGTLKWFDHGAGAAYYAPLIFVPVYLRKTLSGFVLGKLDEDVLFNVTMAEKLAQEYGITVPIPDPLPTDENGIDVALIIQTMRAAVSSLPGWEVFESSAIGVFSFNQFVMWRDLDNNMERFRQNKIVEGMLSSKPYPTNRMPETDANPYRLCLTVPADGSQIKAVSASTSGSFVMHGPPGTGKSQTITNMISNILYEGKTVLFVAEKKAALDVVKKRLDGVGIGNHCLELHSNKTEKSKFLEQLRNAFEDADNVEDGEIEELRERAESRARVLDQYVAELHRPIVAGMSMYELISKYEDYGIEGNVRLTCDYTTVTKEYPESLESAVREAYFAFDRVADVDADLLSDIAVRGAGSTIERDVLEAVSAVRAAGKALERYTAEVDALPVPEPFAADKKRFYKSLDTLDGKLLSDVHLTEYPEIVNRVSSCVYSLHNFLISFNKNWTGTTSTEITTQKNNIAIVRREVGSMVSNGYVPADCGPLSIAEDVDRVIGLYEGIADRARDIERYWKRDVYKSSHVQQIHPEWVSASTAGFFKKGKARAGYCDKYRMLLNNPDPKAFDTLGPSSISIGAVAPAVNEIDSICMKAIVSDRPDLAAFSEIAGRSKTITDMAEAMEADIPQLENYFELRKDAVAKIDLRSESLETWERTFKTLVGLVSYEGSRPADMEGRYAFCDLIEASSGSIYDISEWNGCKTRMETLGIGFIVKEIMDGEDEDEIVNDVYRAFYKGALEYCRMTLKGMNVFGPVSFERSIREFKAIDAKFTNLNKTALRYRLWENLPDNMDRSVAGSEIYTMKRAMNAVRMKKSIRSLISEIPNVLTKVCPCMLMSPLSVSQYLTTDFPLFDVVIFDESSQITTSKAVCALGRGREAIVAGDNKQLPPTSFFVKKSDSEDEDEIIDVDSFLDDCLALDMPQTYLEWHYRSRHESLIAFSNRMFYSSKMLTFPSSNDAEAKVSAVRVNGEYERGKGCNQAEAKAVVDEIYRRVMDPELSKHSIGVIAFGTKQQSCIQDMIEDRFSGDSEFFNAYNAMPEGVFIKNLETVQGDERDVVMFSIGYGPSSGGTVYQNFGPINQEGGSRRLNVAVSRARHEMIVFTSMSFTDIKLTPNSRDGVRSLREFIRFAENGGKFGDQDMSVPMNGESHLLNGLAGELSVRGYGCHFCIGSSGFHVDVAVLDPDHPGKYLLGILNDGESYCNSENTRDREYAREDVLKGLGWNIMHVWSVDWYAEREEVVKRIVERLDILRSGSFVEEEVVDISDDEPRAKVTKKVVRKSRRKPYEPSPMVTDPNYVIPEANIVDIASRVIAEEAPIEEAYLVKICGKMVGMKRISENTRNEMVKVFRNSFVHRIEGRFTTYCKDISEVADRSMYRVSENPETNRKIEYVSLPELKTAVVDTVDMSGSVGEEEIVSAVSKTLGYARVGNNIRDIVSEAIRMTEEEKLILLTNKRYTVV
ncbi:MAG: DUF4011 domain-containing protein [archaeon]|nr:DUF4011 domain-containing protein [archaeon]